MREGAGRGLASVSQSGAYLVSQISNLDGVVGLRYAISFGNQMDVTVSDYLAYLEGDPGAPVFSVYLEGFQRGDGACFLEAVGRIAASGRPVLFYKAGRTREGSAPAASHTASAVGDYEVCRELVASAGVIECATLDMLEDFLMTFSFLARRPSAGRIAVLSNAGFKCTAAADKLYGLELADLEAGTRERIKRLLPPGLFGGGCDSGTTSAETLGEIRAGQQANSALTAQAANFQSFSQISDKIGQASNEIPVATATAVRSILCPELCGINAQLANTVKVTDYMQGQFNTLSSIAGVSRELERGFCYTNSNIDKQLCATNANIDRHAAI